MRINEWGQLRQTILESDGTNPDVNQFQLSRDQHARFTVDATYLDGAPISSSALDISPGDTGWLIRSQIQFAF